MEVNKGERHTHSSHTWPAVRDGVEIDDLADYSHEAVATTNEDDLSTLKTKRLVEDRLIVLDGKASRENAHLHYHDGHGSATDVLAVEDLKESMPDCNIGALGTFELDLLADLDLGAHEELFVFVFVDTLERCVELFISLFLCHWWLLGWFHGMDDTVLTPPRGLGEEH